MNAYVRNGKEWINLAPGDSYASRSDLVLTTLLGSCVSACLYDAERGIAGLNHFLLANHRYSRTMPIHQSEAGRYGIQAMERLINDMVKLGARRTHLQAKAFGGARVFDSDGRESGFGCVGAANVQFIREYLAAEGIRLVSEALGGTQGRVIQFHTSDFSVLVREIRRDGRRQIDASERSFWLQEVRAREHVEDSNVELWGDPGRS